MKKLLFASTILVLILSGCGGTTEPVTEITVVATDFAYEPNMIYVPLGEEVTITFRNEGQVEHDFVIMDISLAGADEHMDEVEGEHMDEAMDDHMEEGEDGHMDEDEHMDEGEDGHADHGEDFAIHALIQPGDSKTIKFTALEAGEYEIFCTVQGHKDAGMIGTLIVVAQ